MQLKLNRGDIFTCERKKLMLLQMKYYHSLPKESASNKSTTYQNNESLSMIFLNFNTYGAKLTKTIDKFQW